MSKRRSNKSVKRMMVDVEKHISLRNGNKKCDKNMWIDWFDGPCLITSSANFIWLSTGTISLTASELKGERWKLHLKRYLTGGFI